MAFLQNEANKSFIINVAVIEFLLCKTKPTCHEGVEAYKKEGPQVHAAPGGETEGQVENS